MTVKLALPKGRLLRKTSAMLQRAGWGIDEYHAKAGFYRPKSQKFPELRLRVFHERDIPIQIAMGNYDLGICCLDWIEELLVKYPSSDVLKVHDLGYGEGALYMASVISPQEMHSGRLIRIVSEYPNLAESFALKNRLSHFCIFPVWGAAEAYPPENADMVLLAASPGGLSLGGVGFVSKVLDYRAFLIANRLSWETKDLQDVVASLCEASGDIRRKALAEEEIPPLGALGAGDEDLADSIRLALPDGHQQQHVAGLLRRAGIELEDYPSATGNRRPRAGLEGVMVKVIRPQDMPQQVATGNFDLAITGRDWLADHLARFPSSPVHELVDLGIGRVRVVAVVSNELAIRDIAELRRLGGEVPLRVASEYVNIADKYARDHHLGYYRIIPTWGASEAFLPEDAELLIENTETGRTITRHNLKIIDTLFESTACLIGARDFPPGSSRKARLMAEVIQRLAAARGA